MDSDAPVKKIIYVDEEAAAAAASSVSSSAPEPSFNDIPRTNEVVHLPANTASIVQGGTEHEQVEEQDRQYEQHQQQFQHHLQQLEETSGAGLIRQEDLVSEADVSEEEDEEGNVEQQGGATRRAPSSIADSSSLSGMSTEDIILMDPIGLKLTYFLKSDDTTVAAFLRHIDEKMTKVEAHLKRMCDIMESNRK